ncbi:MAG: enolase C-terminal domain-like protein [Bacteroidia bacterium]|nr:enolase C-terminal domain-like protein [Bacteroidia bacterium]
MKIKYLKLRYIRLPLKMAFSQANYRTKQSESVILELHTQNGITAFGESNPLGFVNGESPWSVKSDIEFIKHSLLQANFTRLEEIREFITEEIAELIGESSLCVLEIALLNAFSKETGKSLDQIFETEIPKILDYTGVIPLGDLSLMRPLLQKFSFSRVKLKADRNLQLSLENIQILKQIYGADIDIQLDLDCSWNTADALEQIPILIEKGIYQFEQPFETDQDLRMQKLQRHYGNELIFIADESIRRYKDAVRLIKTEACKGFNLKLSKHGGIFQSLAIYKLAHKYGIRCELGVYPGETSLLARAGILLSGLAPAIHSREGAIAHELLSMDICHASLKPDAKGQIEGHQHINKLCSKVDTLRLDKYSSSLAHVA